ncbi:unnamed protein product [Haemonchus placei]|uniref:Uncharacterized protein n=1 Tax=Haemonchus placei TaxID=6290 RepID=A0A158QM99_HAEPC|nr:unnamed protein product [Haemonchus placei]
MSEIQLSAAKSWSLISPIGEDYLVMDMPSQVMPCSLFVPIVKGSRQCAVCQCSLNEHRLTAIYIEPSTIFSAPNTPAVQRKEATYV